MLSGDSSYMDPEHAPQLPQGAGEFPTRPMTALGAEMHDLASTADANGIEEFATRRPHGAQTRSEFGIGHEITNLAGQLPPNLKY
jgi:hypothetical protein